MSFTTGAMLGPYKIMRSLGEGGMGAVYLARDERLSRDVAVKVLHAGSVSDPECQRRFAQEARAVSALNHPNILTVHDIGVANGWPYIVTELIDGESLSSMIAKGAIPTRKFLEIAVQCAAGLAAAHAAGIVHRDIKPSNIMIRRDGCVKILDFGIAKMTQGDSTIAAANETSPGMIVGTANYMSPEQARGEQLDLRSDQFSLGLVFYRMLTGQPAFERSSSAGTMAAIIEDEVPPIAPTIPAPVRWAVQRCLAKDRENRYASTADLGYELKHILEHLSEITAERTSATAAAPPAKRRSLRAVWLSGAALVAGLLSGMLLPPPATPDLSGYTMAPLATEEGFKTSPAWAPNGKDIAYAADVDGVLQIFVRGVHSPTRAQITKAPADCQNPFWSADGATVYYRMSGDLWSAGAAGGLSEVVQKNVSAATLSAGNTLAFLRVDPTGKEPLSLWTASPPRSAPVARTFAPLAGGAYGEGHLAYSRDGSKLGLWLGRWGGRSEVWELPVSDGEPHKLLDLPNFSHEFEWLADNRSIVFGAMAAGSPGPDLQVADTVTGHVRRVTVTPKDLTEPSLSPDGNQLAFSAANEDSDLIQIPLDGSPVSNLLATSRNEMDGTWSPVADQYAYSTDRTGTAQAWIRSRTGDWERPLVTEKDFGMAWITSINETNFSWDGQRIAYAVGGDNGHSVWVSSVQGGSPQRLTPGQADQRSPTWSPDGSWLAFLESTGGHWTLKKAQLGGSQEPVVLRKGCLRSHPKWSKRGDRIACMTEEGLTVISPDGADSKVVSDTSWLVYGWDFGGTRLYGIKRTADRQTVLVSIDVDKGVEKLIGQIQLPRYSTLSGYSLAHDEKSFLTSVNHPTADLWLLSGFQAHLPWWQKWRALAF